MSVNLTRDELVALTEKRQGPAQARVLRHLGIDFRTRPDGSLVVMRTSLHPREASANLPAEEFEIRWDEPKEKQKP